MGRSAFRDGFTDSALTEFGKLFDDVLFPLGVNTFGGVSDIDESGKIIVLMTQRINALVNRNECDQGIITGYFYGATELFGIARFTAAGAIDTSRRIRTGSRRPGSRFVTRSPRRRSRTGGRWWW